MDDLDALDAAGLLTPEVELLSAERSADYESGTSTSMRYPSGGTVDRDLALACCGTNRGT